MSLGADENDEGNIYDNGIVVNEQMTPVQTEDNKVRIRRTKSTAQAEDITEEERKIRRMQPDRPTHKPQDSLFSWSSGFDRYEGFVTWGALILALGGTRLFLENVLKYGIRVNPLHWLVFMHNEQEDDSYYHTPLFLLISNVHFLFAYTLEKLLAAEKLPRQHAGVLHTIHLITIIIIPIVALGIWPKYFSLLGRTMICMVYSVMFLKLWSYAQVNHWCRINRAARKKSSRKRSYSFRNIEDKETTEVSEAASTGATTLKLTQYPENLSLRDLYYFLVAPTLCYELNFPRSHRIRKSFLLRRMVEVVVLTNILLSLFQQWIIPSVKNSFLAFSNMDYIRCTERILKLAIPTHLLWLIWFYLLFHSFLNTLGELLKFADRNFYQDWWNSKDVGTFWRLWNLPVHKWAVRHVFIPMVQAKYSKMSASLMVFIISAFFHEYMVSLPLNMYKFGVFLGMLVQVPLIFISMKVNKQFGSNWGNLMVWASLMLGQPLGIMIYYHDYIVTQYEPEMIAL